MSCHVTSLFAFGSQPVLRKNGRLRKRG
jgi:hypothetical protein